MLRSALLLTALAGGALAVHSTTSQNSFETSKREATATFVVVSNGDLELRDRLHKLGALCHDGGDFLVAELTAGTRAALEARAVEIYAVGELAPNEELFAVAAVDAADLAAHEGQGARVVRHVGRQALVAGPRGSAHRFHNVAAGRNFHGGGARVRRVPMSPPAPFSPPSGGYLVGQTNSGIQAAVNAVDENNIEQHVIDLEAIFTRCATSSGADTARDQIASKLQGFGYSTTFQNFGSQYSENVIAEIPGTGASGRVVVMGAHYDSIGSSCSGSGPGADDNATGTGGVLEAARVLANAGPFEHTIRFVLFSGEELGLLGSGFNSGQSQSSGEDIIAMLNTDMSAYRANGDARDVDFVLNNSTSSLISFCDQVGGLYVPNWASTTGSLSAGTSDHQSYFSDGFPAIFFFEDTGQYSPYIHSSSDSYPQSTTDFLLSKMIVQGMVAALGTLADPVDLSIAHVPLGDTQNPGPFEVRCQVGTPGGGNVTTVDLHYSVDGAPYQVVSMSPDGGDWVGSIPASGSPIDIEYYITADDDQGGSEDLPDGASFGSAPFEFFVGQLVVHYINDFESAGDQGWTHGQVATQDDWQHGAPTGQSGDPGSAYSGTSCWGNDLGIGNFNGQYQPNVENWLRSPFIDLSTASDVKLQYRRWLTVEDGTYDQAQIRVNGAVVWQNPSVGTTNHTLDSSWVKHTIDISAQASGNPSVQIEFRLISDGGLEFGGWTLDDVSLVTVSGVSCGGTSNYCAVSPNSAGAGAVIGSNGMISVASNSFELDVQAAPPNKPGLFFYGPNQVAIPFGEGVRCVGGSLYRLPVLVTGILGDGSHAVNFNALPSGGDINAGTSWNFQFWFRDPAGGPNGFNVSDAHAVTFCP